MGLLRRKDAPVEAFDDPLAVGEPNLLVAPLRLPANQLRVISALPEDIVLGDRHPPARRRVVPQ